jgi:hypothetical protein
MQAELVRLEQRLREEKTRRKRDELEKGWKVRVACGLRWLGAWRICIAHSQSQDGARVCCGWVLHTFGNVCSRDRAPPASAHTPRPQAEQKAAVAAGKKPFFLKKSEKRKRELVAKYEELKAAGKLDKYMAKRARKNASKDHRYLPGRRGDGE